MALRLGAFGPAVGLLHQQLIEAGENVAQLELSSSKFGESTQAAVIDFQASHVGPKNVALKPDGVVGMLTEWALEHPRAKNQGLVYTAPGWRHDLNLCRPAVRPVVALAVSHIGRREDPDGSNDGPQLRVYRTGGQPWCAYAVSTWMSAATGGSPFGRIGSVWGIRDWADRRGLLLPANAILEPGDLGLILRDQRRGHAEMLVLPLEFKKLALVAGNVSNAVRGTVSGRDRFSCFARVL